MLQMKHDMVLVRTNPAAFIDLDRHRPADDIAAGQILGRRREPFHETLTLGIRQITAFAARALGDQHAGAIDTGRVKLHKFHILKRQAGAQRHRIAVAGAGMRRGAGEIDTPIPAGGEDRLLAPEPVQRAIFHAQRDHAGTFAILVHQQIKREELDMEMRLMLQALLIERMQDGVAGPVGGGAGAARHRLAVIKRMAAEGALINPAFLGPREGYAVIFQLDHRRDGVAAHIFNGVLVAKPVRALDGVIHVILPVVAFAHIVQRGADTALGGDRVRACREHLGDAGRAQP